MFKRVFTRLERSLAYFPELTLKGTPEHVGLPFEDLWLKTRDGNNIHAWWIPGPVRPDRSIEATGRPTWIYFHGSGGNISTRLDGYRSIHKRFGANILAFDYRGFGLSPGFPTEPGTYSDGHAAVLEALLRHNSQQHEPGPVVYLGVSMGAAIATKLAAEIPPDVLLLESPPSSFPELAPVQYPWARVLPLSWIMQLRYETRSHISKLNVPLLVVHGDRDNIVPIRYAQSVFESANNPKQFYIVKGGTHNRPDLVDPENYYATVTRFMGDFATVTAQTLPGTFAAD